MHGICSFFWFSLALGGRCKCVTPSVRLGLKFHLTYCKHSSTITQLSGYSAQGYRTGRPAIYWLWLLAASVLGQCKAAITLFVIFDLSKLPIGNAFGVHPFLVSSIVAIVAYFSSQHDKTMEEQESEAEEDPRRFQLVHPGDDVVAGEEQRS